MKILVTGGIGNIGLAVSTYLLERGYAVRIIDKIAPEEIQTDIATEIQAAEYCNINICDFEAVKVSCKGINIIVHMAAIPNPMSGHDAKIFEINASGTFNVFQAAAETGIKRVIAASSINYLGNGFGKRWIDVKYFPIDEEHPGHVTDAYSFSKQVVEHIAQYFWQCDQITSACMRFPFVFNPRQFSPLEREKILQSYRDSYAQLMALSEDEQSNTVRQLLDFYLEIRDRRNQSKITISEIYDFFSQYPGGLLLLSQDDFWTYLDVRDAARVIERAIIADYEGYQPFYITAPENILGLPSRRLAELFYPEVTTWKRDIQGSETLLNCDKAKRMLGFEASSGL